MSLSVTERVSLRNVGGLVFVCVRDGVEPMSTVVGKPYCETGAVEPEQ